MNLTISIIYGSVRADRQGIKAARYLDKKLRDSLSRALENCLMKI